MIKSKTTIVDSYMDTYLNKALSIPYISEQKKIKKNRLSERSSFPPSSHLSFNPISHYPSYMEQDESTFHSILLHNYDPKRHFIHGAVRTAAFLSCIHFHTVALSYTLQLVIYFGCQT